MLATAPGAKLPGRGVPGAAEAAGVGAPRVARRGGPGAAGETSGASAGRKARRAGVQIEVYIHIQVCSSFSFFLLFPLTYVYSFGYVPKYI